MAAKLNIQLTKDQRNMLIFAVLALGGGGFSYFRYFWIPISTKIAEANSKIEEMEGKIEKAKSQAARLPRIQHELEMLSQQAADAEQRLPKDKNVPGVIDMVSRLMQRYGVSLNNFSPGPPSAKQFFIEEPYAVTATGTYDDIGRFFSAVALEERIYNIRNVSYNAPGVSSKGGGQSLSVTFTLVAYQYKG